MLNVIKCGWVKDITSISRYALPLRYERLPKSNKHDQLSTYLRKSRESAQWNFKSLNDNIKICLIQNIFWKYFNIFIGMKDNY